MNETIILFLQQQSSATICCVDEQGKPYCFSCFYAFNQQEGLLYFKSSADSHHSVLMKKNPFIAGTVLPDKLNKIIVNLSNQAVNFSSKKILRAGPSQEH